MPSNYQNQYLGRQCFTSSFGWIGVTMWKDGELLVEQNRRIKINEDYVRYHSQVWQFNKKNSNPVSDK